MRFLFSEVLVPSWIRHMQIGNSFLHFEANSQIAERELIIESDEIFVLGDVNPGFNRLIAGNPCLNTIEENINQLTNGYILFVNRQTETLTLYTDVFGFYHIFYCKKSESIVISSDFNELLSFSKKEADSFAILDIILFNYTLLDRTLIKDIKRFQGGIKAEWKGQNFSIVQCFNYALNFKFHKQSRLKSNQLGNELASHIKNDLIDILPVYLTMSGGFDSRALLAACKSLNYGVNTFTFGQAGNIESETIKSFISEYTISHLFLELDETYVSNIEKLFQTYLLKNLDNPVFHSLIEYEHSNNCVPPSNLVVGFMGGELIIGQSLGAQVTFTEFAAQLLMCNNFSELTTAFDKALYQYNFLQPNWVLEHKNEYLNSLVGYLHKKDNINILHFMLNEEYAKFFGAANKVFRNTFNLITPFTSVHLLERLLNSQISLLRKRQFKKNPIANFKGKILYARAIEYMCPPLSSTRFDRHYRLKDISRLYLLPISVVYYIWNKLRKKNKRSFNATTRYDLWYDNLILNSIKMSHKSSPISLSEGGLSLEKLHAMSVNDKRKYLKIMGIIYAFDKIKTTA